MENRVVKIAFSTGFLAAIVRLPDLHNSCSESGARTAHTIHIPSELHPYVLSVLYVWVNLDRITSRFH